MDAICRSGGPHFGSLLQLHMSDGEIAASGAPAWQRAIGSTVCHTPDVPCSDVPEISFAGLMPLNNALIFNANTNHGDALRPNLAVGTK